MLRILHLAHRHISVHRLREVLQDQSEEDHTWVMVGAPKEKELPGVHAVLPGQPLPQEIMEGNWDAIVVHRMRRPTPGWLLSMPEGPMVVWATWGDDYYRVFPRLSRSTYLPKTRLLLGMLGKMSVSILGLIQQFRMALLPASWRVTNRDLELQAMARAHAVANLFGRDFIALPYMVNPPSLFYSSWYNGVPETIPAIEASRDPAGPILLGGSAATTGNQLDFMWDHARMLRDSGRTLRLNLAYGSGRYAWALKRLASWLLRGRVEWLQQRLPLEEYYHYIAECPVVVHNQVRTQNTGNVVLSFLLGQRVLMRPGTFMHRYFSSLGFIIGDACEANPDLSPLDDASRQFNRTRAHACFGDEAVMARYSAFVADLKVWKSQD